MSRPGPVVGFDRSGPTPGRCAILALVTGSPTPAITTEKRRALVCGAVGLAVGGGVGAVSVWQLAVLCGWIAVTASFLIWAWIDIGPLDGPATAAVATREDNSRASTRLLLLTASVVSLPGAIAALYRATTASTPLEVALTVAAMAAVVTSWLTVHTMFTLRYAHLYYGGTRVGGVTFPGSTEPSYRDFAYLGFTVGMTYQVSDTELDDPVIRATVLRHALLSYLFGTAVIAATINVLAGLVGR